MSAPFVFLTALAITRLAVSWDAGAFCALRRSEGAVLHLALVVSTLAIAPVLETLFVAAAFKLVYEQIPFTKARDPLFFCGVSMLAYLAHSGRPVDRLAIVLLFVVKCVVFLQARGERSGLIDAIILCSALHLVFNIYVIVINAALFHAHC